MSSSTPRRACAALAVAALAAAPLALPVAADAATRSHADAWHDVTTMTYDPETDQETQAVNPAVREGDIKRLGIKHGTKFLTVRAHYVQLSKHDDRISMLGVRLVTRKGAKRNVMVSADPSNWQGEHQGYKGNGDKWKCAGLTHKISWVEDTITLTVPRTCLDNARGVRVGAQHVWMDLDLSAPGAEEAAFTMHADDAYADGKVPAQPTLSSSYVWSS